VAVPAVASVALYSALPHKELRFIFPALPLLNVCAACGLARAFAAAAPPPGKGKGEAKAPSNTRAAQARLLACVGLLAASAAAAAAFAAAAAANYPGGDALAALHAAARGTAHAAAPRAVHVDVAAAMQGVTRFGEANRGVWTYSKDENLESYAAFDFLVTAEPARPGFAKALAAQRYAGIDKRKVLRTLGTCLLRRGPAGCVLAEDAIFVLRREGLAWE